MANTTNNVNTQAQNPMKVITGPDTRWSYANVWEAKSINGGTPKFSVSLIIPSPIPRPSPKSKQRLKQLTAKVRQSLRVMAKLYRPLPPSRPAP